MIAVNPEEFEWPVLPVSEEEIRATNKIKELWAAHQEHKRDLRLSKGMVDGTRFMLGQYLLGMKTVMIQSGRGDQWASYLREHNISPTTADLYMREQEESLPSGSKSRATRPPHAIHDPNAEDIKRLVDRLLPRLQSTLTTTEAVFYFVREIAFRLSPSNSAFTGKGIEIFEASRTGDAE